MSTKADFKFSFSWGFAIRRMSTKADFKFSFIHLTG